MVNNHWIFSTRNPDGTYFIMTQYTYEHMISGATIDNYKRDKFYSREFTGFGYKVKTKSGNTYRVKKFGRKTASE